MTMAGNDEHQLVVHTYEHSSRTNQLSSLCSHTNSLNQARHRVGQEPRTGTTALGNQDCHFIHVRDACNQPRLNTACHKQNKRYYSSSPRNSKLEQTGGKLVIATSLDNLYKFVLTIIYADGG